MELTVHCDKGDEADTSLSYERNFMKVAMIK